MMGHWLGSKSFVKPVLTLIAGFGLAGTALACPDKGDLKEGVTLIRTEPYLSAYFIMGSNGILTEDRSQIRNGDTVYSKLEYIHPLLRISHEDPDIPYFDVEYDRAGAGLDQLPKDKHWSTAGNLVSQEGLKQPLTVDFHYLGHGSETVGECVYEGWYIEEVVDIYRLSSSRSRKFYAPDLGLVLWRARYDSGGQPIPRMSISYDSIE